MKEQNQAKRLVGLRQECEELVERIEALCQRKQGSSVFLCRTAEPREKRALAAGGPGRQEVGMLPMVAVVDLAEPVRKATNQLPVTLASRVALD